MGEAESHKKGIMEVGTDREKRDGPSERMTESIDELDRK